MAAVLRIKLADLLYALTDRPQTRPSFAQTRLFSITEEEELEAIREYLQGNQTTRQDLEFRFNMSRDAVLRRLNILIARGEIERLPGNTYEVPQ